MNFRSCHWRDLALEPPGPSCRGVLAGLPHTTYMLPLGTPWRVLVYGIVFLLVGVPLVFDFATLPAKTHTERERERSHYNPLYTQRIQCIYIYNIYIYVSFCSIPESQATSTKQALCGLFELFIRSCSSSARGGDFHLHGFLMLWSIPRPTELTHRSLG